MTKFEHQLYYWTHTLDESFCKDKITIIEDKHRKIEDIRKLQGKRDRLSKHIDNKDIILRKDIPIREVKRMLGSAFHNVSEFKPNFIRKALLNDSCRLFGIFDKKDSKNVLALAAIIENYGPSEKCSYLHELIGFRKGGYGKKLVQLLISEFKNLWWQADLTEENGKFSINDKLSDVYRSILEVKEHVVKRSIWKCDCNFFYVGIDDEDMCHWLDESFASKKDGEDE